MHFLPKLKVSLPSVPAGLVTALVIIAGSYWGLHTLIYGPEGRVTLEGQQMATHRPNADNPHEGMVMTGPADPKAIADAKAAYAATMADMHGPMMDGMAYPDPDAAFMLGMIPHHQGAIDMANVVLKYGSDAEARALAQHIIADQELEIRQMNSWLDARQISLTAQAQ
jgi:uncharacterized protein (DUF305 family)